MSDERPGDDGEQGDALPPPFRPWTASGVPQPGAERPQSGDPGEGDTSPRRGRVPAPPVPPEYPADAPKATQEFYAPVGGAASAARPPPALRPPPSTVLPPPPAGTRPRMGAGRSVLGPILALLAAGTSWLPWFKTPAAGLFTWSDSRFVRILNAWDVPVRFLWSYHSPRGGPSLGWFILGVAVGILALGFVADAGARGAARLLAGLGALMALLFLVQIARLVDAAPSFGGVDIGVTDFVGLGAYLLLVLSFVLVIVPRD